MANSIKHQIMTDVEVSDVDYSDDVVHQIFNIPCVSEIPLVVGNPGVFLELSLNEKIKEHHVLLFYYEGWQGQFDNSYEPLISR